MVQVTQQRRENAARLASALNLGQTMVAIQDGCSLEQAYSNTFLEHLRLHDRCPCCRGSSTRASEMANIIVSIMMGSENGSGK